MPKEDDNESPPPIFSETNKLMETLESGEDNLFKLKNLLEHKQNYYDKLQQHDNDENKSIAKKRAQLAFLNSNHEKIDMYNTKFREEAKKLYESCNQAYQNVNDIESSFTECEDKLGSIGDILNNESTEYEKKIDELIKLLEDLTQKRNKKLETMEAQERQLRDEAVAIKNQICVYDEKSNACDDDDLELETLDNEHKALFSKLNILNEEYTSLNQESQLCDTTTEEYSKQYNESNYLELEKRFTEVNDEVSQIIENLETQKHNESELSNTLQTLGEYEIKLNKELQETHTLWNDLDQSQCGGFSRIEQNIGKIRADIADRNERYSEAKNSSMNFIEHIKQKDEETGETSILVNQLSLELKEIENIFDNLKSSTHFAQQYDNMTKDIRKLYEEKELLSDSASSTETKIDEVLKFITNDKDVRERERQILEANYSEQIRKMENDYADAEAHKVNLEEQAKRIETEINQLQETTIKLKEEKIQTEKNQEELDNDLKEYQEKLKTFATKKDEIKKKLGSVTAPPPIYVKEHEKSFVKPKTAEMPKKKLTKKQSAVAKRNWDSDSSMEAEEIKLSDFLKKKYKKRPGTEK